MSAAPMPWEKYSQPADVGPWAKYAQPEAAPNAGLAAPAGPSRAMDSGEGPIARNLTSLETQLSKLPGNIISTIGAKHWPILDSRNFHELGEDIKSLNPIVKTDTGETGGIDIGATAANLLPLAVDVKGGGIAESPIGKASSAVIDSSAPAVRATVRGVNRGLAKAPGTIGGAVGAGIGGYVGGPLGAEVGGAAGALAGKEILPRLRIPGEGFGFPERVLGGPKTLEPLSEGDILRARMREVTPQSSPLDRLRNQPLEPEQPAYPGERPSIERIMDQPGASGSMAKSIVTPIEQTRTTRATVEKQLNEALGGAPLKAGVPLRNQAAATGKLPEGFTPAESSVLKGYKYDPATQEFEAITNTGQHYVHGEISPEQFAKFEGAKSKGTAWNELRQNATPLAKVINGKRIATKPGTLETASGKVIPKSKAGMDEDLTPILEESLRAARKKQ